METEKRRHRGPTYSKAIRMSALRMARAGIEHSDIARKLNLRSTSTVSKWISTERHRLQLNAANARKAKAQKRAIAEQRIEATPTPSYDAVPRKLPSLATEVAFYKALCQELEAEVKRLGGSTSSAYLRTAARPELRDHVTVEVQFRKEA